jgi:two-component system, NarL family, invasion response regulator UvrY
VPALITRSAQALSRLAHQRCAHAPLELWDIDPWMPVAVAIVATHCVVMKILIADDHPHIRQGLKQILVAEPDMKVVAEASNGDEALALAHSTDWDVAVFDFSMPGCSGLDLLDHMRRDFPQRPVLIMSVHSEQVHAPRVLSAGASGYVSKDCAPEELTRAIKLVNAGGMYVSTAVAELLAWRLSVAVARPMHEQLSDRQYRVMWLLSNGMGVEEIAQELQLRPSTVATYRARILKKLGLHNTAELVQYAIRHELIE